MRMNYKVCSMLALLVCASANCVAANHTVQVGQSGLTFSPATTSIASGDTITFVNSNTGGLAHNVVSDDGGTTFSSGAPMSGPWTFTTGPITNKIAFHCTVHGTAGPGGGVAGTGMAGSINVSVPVTLQSFEVN